MRSHPIQIDPTRFDLSHTISPRSRSMADLLSRRGRTQVAPGSKTILGIGPYVAYLSFPARSSISLPHLAAPSARSDALMLRQRARETHQHRHWQAQAAIDNPTPG
jgi:hypothetical protein